MSCEVPHGKKATKLLALIEEYAATMKDCYLVFCSHPKLQYQIGQ